MTDTGGGGDTRRHVVLIAAGVLVAITAVAAVVADRFLDHVVERRAGRPDAGDAVFSVRLTRADGSTTTRVAAGEEELGELMAPDLPSSLTRAANAWRSQHARVASSPGSGRAVVDAGPGVPQAETDRVVDVLVSVGFRAVTYASGARPR